MNQENKDWIKDFDEWYGSYLDGNGHPPKSSVLSYIIRLLKKQEKEIREEMIYFWRECHNCGFAGTGYLHCMHDGVQTPCHNCTNILPSVEGDCECEFVLTQKDLTNND